VYVLVRCLRNEKLSIIARMHTFEVALSWYRSTRYLSIRPLDLCTAS
jgi:hypothetical protein